MRRLLVLAALLIAALGAAAPAVAAESTATGTGGAASSVDALATGAALQSLRDGGNAVDAAVAAAGVLGVVEPFSSGIGGGGFMVIRTKDGKVTTVDSRETAPAAMSPTSFFADGKPLTFADARLSGLSAGVPGTVRGWELALREYGTWSLGRALKPGIHVAKDGFPVDETFAGQIEDNQAAFAQVPSTAAIYLDPDGTPRDVGSTLRNPDLAGTYEAIAKRGADAFYNGPIAQSIVDAVDHPPVEIDATHPEVFQPGVMTTGDLAAYEALERDPTHSQFRGLDVYGMGPPSSGGTTVGEILNILDRTETVGGPASGGHYDARSQGADGPPTAPLGGGGDRARALHLFMEASALAYADRGAYLGDPAYVDVPVAGLLSPEFASVRRALIDPAATAPRPVQAGDPLPYDDTPPPVTVPTIQRTGSTTHLTVADDAGNVVSYTFTIEQIGGNAIVVPGRGFLLNNELTDFSYDDPDTPNRVEGGKRPRSSMAPTIVERDGQPLLAVGSPGGATIITTVAQVLFDRLGLGSSLPAAVAAPRVSERNTAKADAEPGFIASPEGQSLASTYGHVFNPVEEIGTVAGVEWLGDGRLLAAAEPVRRGGGSAGVVTPSG
jgi:gamma-glutamyltranspeptidase/glutathione hydrolase